MSFLKDPQEKAAEDLLKRYGAFLRNYKHSIAPRLSTNKANFIPLHQIEIDYGHDKEKLSMFQLLESENKLLSKILVVFFHLSRESKKLHNAAGEIIEKLILVEDDISSNDSASELTPEEASTNAVCKFSFVLEDLLNMKFLIQNSIFTSVSVFHQLAALLAMEKYFLLNPATCFPCNFDDVGLMMKNLLLFDSIFLNSNYKTYLQLYGELISSSSQLDENVLRNLQNTLHELDLLLEGNIFQIAIDNLLTLRSKLKQKTQKKLESCMFSYIKNIINSIDKFEPNMLSELTETDEIIKLNIFVVLFYSLFGQFDPKSLRMLTDINSKYCTIVMHNIVWNGSEFLRKFAPGLFKSSMDVSKIQQSFMTQKLQSLSKDTAMFASQIALWIIQMEREAELGTEQLIEKTLKLRCEMFYRGLNYAGQISYIIKSITSLHMKFSIAMPKQVVPLIYKLIEFLRIIQNTYKHHELLLVDSIGFLFQYLQFLSLNVVNACKKKIIADAKKEKKFDLSTSLVLVERLLYGTVSKDRLNAISLTLNLTEPAKHFGPDVIGRLLQFLDHLMILSELQENLAKLTDPSFLFWHQNLVSAYFKQILDSPLNQPRVSLLLDAANDCLRNTKSMQLENVRSFHPYVRQEFEQQVITRLCNSIEINLRLDFHSNLQVEKFNPFATDNKISIEDRRALVALKPIELDGEYISVRDHIEHYLSKMFYNLTTISLIDWRTYGEMRYLAERKYNLETVDDHLPNQSLDQGLDVLEIMRNIHIFVARYLYNLNNQVFIEASSKNQHLNTINIRVIANSLRTHGTGIVNTTVNYVYQFLRKKFFIFSQFIFDERIKSRLAKDLKHHRDNLEKNNQIYSYDKASAFNRDIKKLGAADNGESFLDQFRKLISQIGNSMGYIRMIRSGCNHVCSTACVCLPALDEELEFVQLCKDNGLSATTVAAAGHLEEGIQQLSKNYAEGTLYFKLLVNTFIPFFQSPKNSHLKNFYIIVPALTINFIEYILTAKDKLNKKNKDGALFTDDGFAMGLIYILKMLDQILAFNSLNWYKAIKLKIKGEREKIASQRAKITSSDDKLLNTLLLSEMRLNAFQQEFELLFFNLSSAKIFFQN